MKYNFINLLSGFVCSTENILYVRNNNSGSSYNKLRMVKRKKPATSKEFDKQK